MKCQICQEKEATVHFTEIAEDNVIKLHLCEACAKTKGIGLKSDLGLGDFLSSLTEMELSGSEGEIRCPQCGISLRDFRRAGRLGCGKCYEAFEKNLLPLIRSLHRAERHSGKVPPPRPPGQVSCRRKALQEALRAAVAEEEYEKAAKLRDLIKQLGKASVPGSKGPRRSKAR